MQVVLKEDGKSMVVSDDDIRGNLKVSNAWIFNINRCSLLSECLVSVASAHIGHIVP